VSSDKRLRLSAEELAQIGARIKAATYTMNNHQLDVLFNRLDHDRSGCMNLEDLRRALRKYFKISPSVVSDFELDELCAAVGDQDFGLIGIRDFKGFIGLESAASQQSAITPRNLAASTGSSAYGSDISPRKADQQKILPGGNLFTVFKRRGPPITEEAVNCIRMKLRNEMPSTIGGRYLTSLFARFDRDGTGRLQDDEVRISLRRTLRISPTSLSDADIYSACAAIDVDCAGSVRIEDLVTFICGSKVLRDGRRMPWESS
jgi:Ca2+-binding EF-hand superfamily protein